MDKKHSPTIINSDKTECRSDALEWFYLERADYSAGLNIQRELHRIVLSNAEGKRGFLLLIEHERPVITIGRFAKESNILFSEQELKARGIEVYRVGRGGDVTFHGPGQLVGYPIINLRDFKLRVRSYVHLLEEALIAVLGRFNIEGKRIEGYPGVWVGRDKVAAIGVQVKNSTTMHGFSLNVNTDLSYFSIIVPCGIRDMGVTSMEKALGKGISVKEVVPIFAEEFGRIFQTTIKTTNGLPLG